MMMTMLRARMVTTTVTVRMVPNESMMASCIPTLMTTTTSIALVSWVAIMTMMILMTSLSSSVIAKY